MSVKKDQAVSPIKSLDTCPQSIAFAHRRAIDGEIQPLKQHLLSVGRLSSCHASKLNLSAAGEILGLLHDLGKYSRGFQSYLASAVGLIDQDGEGYVDAEKLKGRIDHSTAGAQYIWRKLSKDGQVGVIAGQLLALCIASHHSGLIDCLSPDGDDNFSRRIGKDETSAHFNDVVSRIDPEIAQISDRLIGQSRLAGDIVKAINLIAETERQKEGSGVTWRFKVSLLTRFLFSCLVDADRIDSADFANRRASTLRHHGAYPAWDVLIARLEEKLSGFPAVNPIDGIRHEISDHSRIAASRPTGCFTLTVPTGGGKTLASLRFALHHAKTHGLDHIIYIIPFTSIIDQNADVVREILEPDGAGIDPGSIVLEHHSNLTPEEQSWRAKILSENWDAPVIYTTSVQLLETLFGAGTRGARRMHQLAKAVIVFDEVQTVPIRCVHMFNNAINFLVEHCGSSVVLCTATQPLLNEVNQAKGAARFGGQDEIMPDAVHLFSILKRVEVLPMIRPGGWSAGEVAQIALEQVAETGNCLTIVNTRKSALSLYHASAGHAGQTVYHLSTAMCPVHRRAVLAEIRLRLAAGRDAPTLCVSTQLIETGVDVDFGAGIRYVAGLDSIAQAAGRVNRNGRRAIGRLCVVNPADEQIGRLIDIRVGRDVTMRILSEFGADPARFDGDLLGPKAMAAYYLYYFHQRASEMEYPVPAQGAAREENLLRLLSDNAFACESYKLQNQAAPPVFLQQSFMSAASAFKAIDAPTKGVIVPYGEDGQSIIEALCRSDAPEQQYGLLRRAQQYSVNVFPHVFASLLEKQALSEVAEGTGIFYLRGDYYSEAFGLGESPSITTEQVDD